MNLLLLFNPDFISLIKWHVQLFTIDVFPHLNATYAYQEKRSITMLFIATYLNLIAFNINCYSLSLLTYEYICMYVYGIRGYMIKPTG